jgi:hypothetical protein
VQVLRAHGSGPRISAYSCEGPIFLGSLSSGLERLDLLQVSGAPAEVP